MVGGLAEPLHRLGVVLEHALAFVVHEGKRALSLDGALIRCNTKPLRCFSVVLRYVYPFIP